MQPNLDNLFNEFTTLWTTLSSFVVLLLILTWFVMHQKFGRTMSQRRYSVTTTALSAAFATLVMLLPSGIIVVTHPGFTSAFLERLITEFPQYFGLLIIYVLVAALGGWYFTKLYPANQIPENSQ